MRTGMKRTFVFIFVFKCPCSKSSAFVLALNNRSRPLHQRAECGTVSRVMDGISWWVHSAYLSWNSYLRHWSRSIWLYAEENCKRSNEDSMIFQIGAVSNITIFKCFFLKLIPKPYVEPSDSIEERNSTDSSDPPLKRKRQIGNEKDPPPLLFSFTYP